MASDTKEIITPNNRKVVIRTYTTHGDDLEAERLQNEGMTVEADETGKPNIHVSVGAALAADRRYVELLVQSIDGDTANIPARLKEMRSEDYATVDEAVRNITSPKDVSKS
jgi:hypothetical protein